jgi:hypothetical protein
MDKGISTIVGRPPRIASRYCNNVLPLEVDDDVYMLEGEELDAALSHIDDQGWNGTGKFSSATWIRLKALVGRSREEALEICLGNSQSDLEQRIQ